MAANNAYSVSQTTLGIAKEITRGTPVTPAYWIPVKSPKYDPNLQTIEDDTLQGSMVGVYNLTRGMRYDGHGWDSFPYLDTFPLMVMAELGSTDSVVSSAVSTTLSAGTAIGATTITTAATVPSNSYITIGTGATMETHKTNTVSGSTAPYTVTLFYPCIFAHLSTEGVVGLTQHKFSLLNNAGSTGNQPPAMTLTDFDGEEWRQMSACQLDELTIKGNGTGYVDYTTTWFGNPSITPASPTPSFTTVQAVPGWRAQIAIGGTYLNYVMDWEFDLKRGVKPIPALTGTEAYFMYFANALQSPGKLTVVEQSGAPELTQYLNGTQEVFDFTLCDDNTGFALNIHSSKCQFRKGSLDRSKVENVEAVLDFQMLPTAADALAGGVSPCVITIANNTVGAY